MSNIVKRQFLKYLYKSALFPDNEQLLKDVNNAAERLNRKLVKLQVKDLKISDYSKKYLGNQIADIGGTLQRYAYIIIWSLAYQKIPREQFIFIDYGGGSGILSLLAKELGIGTVLYNDIYDVSCKDSKVIGQKIGNEADFYVVGDIDNLISFLDKNSFLCNAIASYDVIEHIYNIEDFMKKICFLSTKPYNIIMSSGANSHNPIIKKRLAQQQLDLEFKGQKKEWGHKERDCLKAYYAVRKEIIGNFANGLPEAEIDLLAKVTRGLIESDIKELVAEYLRSGEKPPEPAHPTNTCDPYTGNWAEHLMDINDLKRILSRQGFEVEIMAGYYGQTSNDIKKRALGRFFNPIIAFLGSRGLTLAPFYTIYGKKL